jgi:hypothetical protein
MTVTWNATSSCALPISLLLPCDPSIVHFLWTSADDEDCTRSRSLMLDMFEYTRVPDELLSTPYDYHPARLPGNRQ